VFEPLSIEAAARSETGQRRTTNQDAFAIRADLGLYLLCDGMGGHAAGEVAAAIAVETIQQFYVEVGAPWPPDAPGPASDPRAVFVAAVKHANDRVRQLAELSAEYRGMGAAVAGVHISSAGFCLVHVGHVRAYRFRDGAIERLTQDHTVLNRYIGEGATFEAANRLPGVSRLERALGLRERVHVTSRSEDAQPGDVVALMSNGLYDAISEAQMARILGGRTPLDAMADSLIGVAQAHGAPDDVSCVLLRCAPAEAGDVVS
jgi:serine/threonine protein phosphatase PrpC